MILVNHHLRLSRKKLRNHRPLKNKNNKNNYKPLRRNKLKRLLIKNLERLLFPLKSLRSNQRKNHNNSKKRRFPKRKNRNQKRLNHRKKNNQLKRNNPKRKNKLRRPHKKNLNLEILKMILKADTWAALLKREDNPPWKATKKIISSMY